MNQPGEGACTGEVSHHPKSPAWNVLSLTSCGFLPAFLSGIFSEHLSHSLSLYSAFYHLSWPENILYIYVCILTVFLPYWNVSSVTGTLSLLLSTLSPWLQAWCCIRLLGLPFSFCRLGGSNNRNLFSHDFGGWKSPIRVSDSFGGLRRKISSMSFSWLLAVCWQFLVFLILYTQHPDLCLHLLVALLLCMCVCLCPNFPFL